MGIQLRSGCAQSYKIPWGLYFATMWSFHVATCLPPHRNGTHQYHQQHAHLIKKGASHQSYLISDSHVNSFCCIIPKISPMRSYSICSNSHMFPPKFHLNNGPFNKKHTCFATDLSPGRNGSDNEPAMSITARASASSSVGRLALVQGLGTLGCQVCGCQVWGYDISCLW